ncbi:unnamed protein product [Thlaspi arvense]|uniref:Uncharacterized protein n=1 Tax=Thlaspi arvense TaxID=13288 RepID=A0AAU9SCY1_THLAR|nr:unnamed protein product [Thlaspi arvense]
MDKEKKRYSRSIRDGHHRDLSADHSPEHEGGRHSGDSKRNHYHHERFHEGSTEKQARLKRKDREEENRAREGNKKPRFCGERRKSSRFEDVAVESENNNAQVRQAHTETAVKKPTKVHVLRLDALGREIDEQGHVISVTKPGNLTTLKINLKKDALQILEPHQDPQENPYFDPRMGDIDKNKISRPRQLLSERVTRKEKRKEPIPMLSEPPAEAAPPPPQPLKLTKKERKKLRTQRREAKEKESQEMVKLATQDPTKLEKEIRKAAAEREQAHTDRNAARKLTPAERHEKKERKLFDDPTTVGTVVSVYKIKKLSHPKTRFKVEMDASQNSLTGCCVMMADGMSIVVVEGKSKTIKRYKKLMLERIKWKEAEKKEEDEDEEEEEEENGGNKCWLVWQGSVLKPSFHRFHVQDCLTESAAKKVFTDAGVAPYWNLALNHSDD